jgi:hypothetical protein
VPDLSIRDAMASNSSSRNGPPRGLLQVAAYFYHKGVALW